MVYSAKHLYVYTITGCNNFLRIYYARVDEYLTTLEPKDSSNGSLAATSFIHRSLQGSILLYEERGCREIDSPKQRRL